MDLFKINRTTTRLWHKYNNKITSLNKYIIKKGNRKKPIQRIDKINKALNDKHISIAIFEF